MRPRVQVRFVGGLAVYDVLHRGRRVTWPTWQIAMSHANRLAVVAAETALRRAV